MNNEKGVFFTPFSYNGERISNNGIETVSKLKSNNEKLGQYTPVIFKFKCNREQLGYYITVILNSKLIYI